MDLQGLEESVRGGWSRPLSAPGSCGGCCTACGKRRAGVQGFRHGAQEATRGHVAFSVRRSGSSARVCRASSTPIRKRRGGVSRLRHGVREAARGRAGFPARRAGSGARRCRASGTACGKRRAGMQWSLHVVRHLFSPPGALAAPDARGCACAGVGDVCHLWIDVRAARPEATQKPCRKSDGAVEKFSWRPCGRDRPG